MQNANTASHRGYLMIKRIVAGTLALSIYVGAAAAPTTFTLTSPDLPAGKPIAEQFTANTWGCHGANESPDLKWVNAPAGTKSFAITMFDPYRPPASGWWHWLVYDIPASATELPRTAGTPGNPGMPQGARQVKPDGEAPEPHYYGPCPDEGDPPHHYTITIYALSVDHLKAPDTATPADIDSEIASKTIGKAQLVRLFSRPKNTE
jgi:Raf kinase inhibitor-like YbhB/YbcL family protein